MTLKKTTFDSLGHFFSYILTCTFSVHIKLAELNLSGAGSPNTKHFAISKVLNVGPPKISEEIKKLNYFRDSRRVDETGGN